MALHDPNETVLAHVRGQHRLFIDNEWHDAASGKTFEVRNPATGEVVAHVAEGEAQDIDRAVQAARRAFDERRWHGLPPEKRANIMWKLAELFERDARTIAEIEVIDNGMPIAFAEWMVGSVVQGLKYYAGMITKLGGRNASPAIASDTLKMHAYTSVEPVGVVGTIIPWNGPIGVMMIKLSPALAAGCSVVVKPAELTPLSALYAANLMVEAGIPAGVVNIVPGFGATAGQALVDHPEVDKISFTGSTATGKKIVQSAAETLKRVTLELGGKSPVIVFDDADPEVTIPGAAMGIFANTGQVCFAGSRLFVQKKSYDKVVAGISDFAKGLRIGHGFDPANAIGPLISEGQRDKVSRYLETGVQEGAEVVTGGSAVDSQGYYIEPTVFANVNADMRIVREEIFGPVLVATPVDDIDDLVRAANDTRYGLGAGIYTTDVNKAHLTAARLQAGNVWINGYGMMHPAMPFGGYKESGWGRENAEDGIRAYQEAKSVFVYLKG
ncbi:aldehyde dehydrogenase family protein [Novosphingobium resinovorum]|uniref:aldehyde dehydrogenase family protein n=1 Tax=Novosphingobium TaxID=165696 RepID=UPI001B3C50F3|nr:MULTISPECIES: aldehyde dehydrogenase family protein [Novosphingobium]MBF7014727.1 aldehyde dehydrogenase family protein [Novosphingobium sp. HR1a]WJM24791.1 aldehyde dehydrogenase family protein [Novosphingobium resinovorum]